MNTKVLMALGFGILVVLVITLFLWNPFTWKPGSQDVVMRNTSGSRPEIYLWLSEYDKYQSRPYYWRWSIEFWLENRYKDDLDIEFGLQIFDDDRDDWPDKWGPTKVIVPGEGKKRIELHAGFWTASRDIIPQGIYRVMARAELEHKSGIEVKMFEFEWELVSGWINRTTKTHIPEKIPGI